MLLSLDKALLFNLFIVLFIATNVRAQGLSTPLQCSRTCVAGEQPRVCYYKFVLEYYMVLTRACEVCTPNATNSLTNACQCILADGFERGILTANRMLPGPSIEVCEGDRVVIDVDNRIEGHEVALHWHGIWQRGSQYYDGAPFVTQCPITESTTFRYQWDAANAGTHFWHSHSGFQKLDGLFGALVVRKPQNLDPSGSLYDLDLREHQMLINDWLHEYSTEVFPGRRFSRLGQAPVNILINGKGQFTDPTFRNTTTTPLEVFQVSRGRRYRFRLINSFCTVCPAAVTIQGHSLTVIATDGEAVHPVTVDTIISYSGERYDFVLTANQPVGTYWIQVRGLGECVESEVQQMAILRYVSGPAQPTAPKPVYRPGLPNGVILNPLDGICNVTRNDAICVNQLRSAIPVDQGIFTERPDVRVYLPFEFLFYEPRDLFRPNVYNHFVAAFTTEVLESLVDGISYVAPPSPPLSQLNDIPSGTLCNSDNLPSNCRVNCTCAHTIDIPINSIVEVVLVDANSQPFLAHPFHLHGYSFSVVGMGADPDKSIMMSLNRALELDRKGLLNRQFNLPPFKDTISVPQNGYVIFRFRAINPGYWFFHCHFLYHINIGMNVIFHVGTRNDLPPVPPNFPRCGNYLPNIQFPQPKQTYSK